MILHKANPALQAKDSHNPFTSMATIVFRPTRGSWPRKTCSIFFYIRLSLKLCAASVNHFQLLSCVDRNAGTIVHPRTPSEPVCAKTSQSTTQVWDATPHLADLFSDPTKNGVLSPQEPQILSFRNELEKLSVCAKTHSFWRKNKKKLNSWVRSLEY